MCIFAITPARMNGKPPAVRPTRLCLPVPEEERNTPKHGNRDPESVCAVVTPIGTHHADLIRDRATSNAGNHDAYDELADSTWSTPRSRNVRLSQALAPRRLNFDHPPKWFSIRPTVLLHAGSTRLVLRRDIASAAGFCWCIPARP